MMYFTKIFICTRILTKSNEYYSKRQGSVFMATLHLITTLINAKHGLRANSQYHNFVKPINKTSIRMTLC